MSDGPENMVLVHLRRVDEKIDRLIDDMRDLKVRVTDLEEEQAGVLRRLDRIEARPDRIERRLDLVEPSQ